MKIKDMNKGEWGKTKALFSIETNEGIVIKGFKIVEGANGLFVSNPSSYSKKNEKWYDDVWMPEELKDKLSEDALTHFGGESSTGGSMPF